MAEVSRRASIGVWAYVRGAVCGMQDKSLGKGVRVKEGKGFRNVRACNLSSI